MNNDIDQQQYEEFIFKKISDESLDDGQVNFLLSIEGDENISAALESMDIWKEFKTYISNFEDKFLKKQQDIAYQKSLIEDHIRKFTDTLVSKESNLLPLREKMGQLMAAHQNWGTRAAQFPENPRFQENLKDVELQIMEIDSKITPIAQEVEQLKGEISSLQTAKITLA